MYQVYRNLHNKSWSIKDKESGLVVGHAKFVVLLNAKFIVNESGRQRVLRDKQKNVHAYIEGDIMFSEYKSFKGRKVVETNAPGPDLQKDYFEATYNPYRYSSFVNKTSECALTKAQIVEMTEDMTVHYQP